MQGRLTTEALSTAGPGGLNHRSGVVETGHGGRNHEETFGKSCKRQLLVCVSPSAIHAEDLLPIMSSPKVLILRAFSLNITSQNRAKGVRQSSYPVLNSHKRV